MKSGRRLIDESVFKISILPKFMVSSVLGSGNLLTYIFDIMSDDDQATQRATALSVMLSN